jgi:hypothetical protein
MSSSKVNNTIMSANRSKEIPEREFKPMIIRIINKIKKNTTKYHLRECKETA